MLGGGFFTSQNKKLPGTYINFVSASTVSTGLSERGVAAMPLKLDWGIEDKVFIVTSEEFKKNAASYFGYDYDHEKLKPLRDLFMNINTLYAYRLNSNGVKASNKFATAKYTGVRGNDIKIAIQKNVDDETAFDVVTYVGTKKIDTQTVKKADELVSNEFIEFKADVELTVTASTPLENGTNGDEVTTSEYQKFLNKIESYQFNALGCPVVDTTITDLFVAFTKRMREELGTKFQTVVYRKETADYEGVISVENKVLDDDNLAALVYWVTGAAAGCAVNASNTNKVYNGEYEADIDYTQAELAEALEKGKFILHNVTDEVRVLEDINTFTSYVDDKGIDFSSNQTVRVIDQIATDVASVFATKYLGSIPNNGSGRTSLWSDIVDIHKELERIQAIENFNSEDIVISQGNSKKSIVVQDKFEIVNAMSQIYMTCVVA